MTERTYERPTNTYFRVCQEPGFGRNSHQQTNCTVKKYLFVLICIAAFGGCKVNKGGASSLQKTKVEDFISFIGVTKGDNYDKVLRDLGKPTEIDKNEKPKYSFVSCYYNDANSNRMFSYTYDKETKAVGNIRLTGELSDNFSTTKRFLAAKGIDDPKINFLGMHKKEILKIFGKPDRISSGNYEYVRGPVQVTFICYDFNEEKCSEIYLFWNIHL